MSITTNSIFYYGITIDESNKNISFDEGAGEIIAILNAVNYTQSEIATELARAMTDVGTQEYNVTFDRINRSLIISASSNFNLLISTSTTTSTSGYETLGFIGADKLGNNTYSGIAFGKQYRPQLLLQSYVPTKYNKQPVQSSVIESASGITQSLSYGIKRNMKCNISFITNIEQGLGNPITTNTNGVQDAIDFMEYITDKNNIEFMEDENNKNIFEKVLLESTSKDKKGTSYELYELYNKKLPNYFETKLLTFKKVV